MPARDTYHYIVKKALIKEGWTITDDPFRIKWKGRNLYVDLGAELLSAKKENDTIVVEIKSFIGHSEVNDLENALGQYMLYHDILKRTDAERTLFLAIPKNAWKNLFSKETIGEILLEEKRLNLIVFELSTKRIIQWIIP